VRATVDVDAIVEIASYSQYANFGQRLREIGFDEDTSEGAPLCRWKQGPVILDAMPLDEKILGFSNRWYAGAMATAETIQIVPSLWIRTITAPFFLATKIEAFKGRGGGDFLGSHDLEDALALIDGRPIVLEEVHATSDDLRAYVRLELAALLGDPRFIDALPGHLPPDAASQERIPILLQRIQDFAHP
jgi:hypothetical protein